MRKLGFKQKYLIFLVTMCLLGVSLYYSYAIFVTKQLQENVLVIKTPQSNITFGIDGKQSVLLNALEEKSYQFIIHNNEAKEYNYEVYQKSHSGVKVTCDGLARGKISGNSLVTINLNIINTNNTNEEIMFDVSISTNNELIKPIGYSYLNSEPSFDHSKANHPQMKNLYLIPVSYHQNSEKEGYWYKSDVSNQEDLWYDYDHGIWANAVLVSKTNYQKYLHSEIGEEINVSDIIGFYVWIPRFKYYVVGNDNYTNYEKINNVLFEKGNASTGTILCSDDVGEHIYSEKCHDEINGKIYEGLSTYTHPAFRDKEGFWVSKFLMSNGKSLKSIPNAYMHKLSFQEAVDLSEKQIVNHSHLLTNMEYGSILILANSMYGKSYNANYVEEDNYLFKRVYANNYENDLTGCSTDYNKYSKSISTNTGNVCVTYNDFTDYTHVSNGVKYLVGPVGPGASSTGTIYGVYDLANRTGEMVAGVASSQKDIVKTSFLDIYSDNNYQGIIASSKSIANLYRYKLGDAIRENMRVLGENGMYMGGRLEHKTNGVIVRGGNGEIKNASVYTSSMQNVTDIFPFRVVITSE